MGKAKLTEAQVREIRRLRSEGRRLKNIAPAFRVTMALVSLICARKIWRHV